NWLINILVSAGGDTYRGQNGQWFQNMIHDNWGAIGGDGPISRFHNSSTETLQLSIGEYGSISTQ
ncbi:MAG: hypothetical protein KDC56_06035, partial [Flavobacteriaceae bacterium]|nr:hypothetical protein [Flavobacteriaceae bacterium]